MTAAAQTQASGSIRIDRLLVYLRLARTRSAALALVESCAVRRNTKHVLRGSEPVRIGDVLTIALGQGVRVIELLALPDRRGPPDEARSHYREVDQFHEVDRAGLDPKWKKTLAASPRAGELLRDDPEHRL